eukprot:scaffold135437_cov36-Tisochrysis_lutea.AAC.1
MHRQYWSWRAFQTFRRHNAYFEPMAVVEASVAIVAGVVIWLGFWDTLTCAAPSSRAWQARIRIPSYPPSQCLPRAIPPPVQNRHPALGCGPLDDTRGAGHRWANRSILFSHTL